MNDLIPIIALFTLIGIYVIGCLLPYIVFMSIFWGCNLLYLLYKKD
jgi:hypothetical protein